MLCERCHGKSATVHLTKISNGHKTEEYLCLDCARQGNNMMDNLENFNPFNWISESFPFLGRNEIPFSGKPEKESRMFSGYRSLDESSAQRAHRELLGSDYQSFREKLRPLFGQKDKKGVVQSKDEEDGILELKVQLKKSIADENFEEAARLRDEIKKREAGEK